MQSKLTDIELIQRTLIGDQQAYALLVKTYQRYVFTLALRFTKSREDAEEVAQDSFIKVYKALSSFKQESKFSTWLYTIVYTTAMTSLRKRNTNTVALDDEDNFTQVENATSATDINNAENRSRSFYLNQAISQLSADDAAVLTLFYHAEQSLEEIALIMDIETNGVKIKLFRARRRLKEKLERNLKHEVKELI
nr:sigma-70 family RNA polymerase sigma factor [uncultured Mucilaginibacter sp.]